MPPRERAGCACLTILLMTCARALQVGACTCDQSRQSRTVPSSVMSMATLCSKLWTVLRRTFPGDLDRQPMVEPIGHGRTLVDDQRARRLLPLYFVGHRRSAARRDPDIRARHTSTTERLSSSKSAASPVVPSVTIPAACIEQAMP